MIRNNLQRMLILYNVILLVGFGLYFLREKNAEFSLYVGVIVAVLTFLLVSNKKIQYSNSLLLWFTLWGTLHIAGGTFYLSEGRRLYDLVFISLSAAPLEVLRYDQVVHFIGFGSCTLLARDLLREYLVSNRSGWIPLAFIVWSFAMGLGALNEVLEFGATLILSSTGVGGYYNTGLDLCSNLLGVTVFTSIIAYNYRKEYQNQQ